MATPQGRAGLRGGLSLISSIRPRRVTTADPHGEAEAGAGLQEGQVLVLLLAARSRPHSLAVKQLAAMAKICTLGDLFVFFFFCLGLVKDTLLGEREDERRRERMGEQVGGGES